MEGREEWRGEFVAEGMVVIVWWLLLLLLLLLLEVG